MTHPSREDTSVPKLLAPERPVALRPPELLAPVGDRESLLAALNAGADAVYLGLADVAFGARRKATNFTLEGLAEACDLAHLADRRVYLTLNTLVKHTEMDEALLLARQAWECGIDALIVADLGLISRLSRELPDCRLHASTQMGLHSVEGIRAVAAAGRRLKESASGFSTPSKELLASSLTRITLARELSLDEVQTIATEAAELGLEIEVFAHGALCVCSSGQCLFSSMVGGRSANRGLCAQACRLPYRLIDSSTGRAADAGGEHLLSTADLATLDILEELVATGVSSLKIEGRMKSAAYVATTTAAYRARLDLLVCADTPANRTTRLSSQPAGIRATETLAEVYSRGFTSAYLAEERGNAMMSYQRPNNQGTLIGRVSALRNGWVELTTETPVARGDMLEFRTNSGQTVVELNDFTQTDGRLRLRIDTPVGRGDRVFRVRNARLLADASETYGNTVFAGNRGLVDLAARIRATLGEPLELALSASGQTVEVTGPIVEAARSRALTETDICEHIGRVGNTPFSLTAWDITLDEGVGLGFSLLHKMRAEALEQLTERLLEDWHHRRDEPMRALPPLPKSAVARKGLPLVGAIVADAHAADLARKAGADRVYLNTTITDNEAFRAPSGASRRTSDTSRPSRASSTVDAFYLPTIAHNRDLPALAALFEGVSAIDPVASPLLVANNLAEVALAQATGVPFEAGPALGVCNPDTLRFLAREGAAQAWLSPELTRSDIEALAATAPVLLALVVAGRQEVMVTEHCLLMAKGPCDQHCERCPRRRAEHLLEDRKGYRFPIRTDCFGRSHLYNAVPLDLIPAFPELLAGGISTFIVDATLMNAATLTEEVARARRALGLALTNGASLSKREGRTTGHLYRGVL